MSATASITSGTTPEISSTIPNPASTPIFKPAAPSRSSARACGSTKGSGHTWYNGLHTKWERRFNDGVLFTLAYALGRHMEQAAREPHAPDSYNRGRNSNDRTHIFAFNSVYEVPIGRGRKLLPDANPVVDAVLGGLAVDRDYRFWSGSPLSFIQRGATLGNGRSTRADVSGNPELSNPTADAWFNKDAFHRTCPPHLRQLGARPDGRSRRARSRLRPDEELYILEDKYVQFRWEMFNGPNHVNLNNPVTTLGIGTTGRIFSAKTARQMQFGLKFIY